MTDHVITGGTLNDFTHDVTKTSMTIPGRKSAVHWVNVGLFGTMFMTACHTDFVSPEDDRCTIYVDVGEYAEINRWQIDNCESVRVFVRITQDGTRHHSLSVPPESFPLEIDSQGFPRESSYQEYLDSSP